MNTERDRDSIIQLFVQKFPAQTAELVNVSEFVAVQHSLAAMLAQFKCPETFFHHLSEKVILASDKREGNTLLHVAARWNGKKVLMDAQRDVVARIIKACPAALSVLNRAGQSAYQLRLHSYDSEHQEGDDISSSDDPISWFLKTEIMNLGNREEIIRLLYGESQDMEIELDLLDLANHDVEKSDLENLLNSLKFESILRYVKIPQYTLREDPSLDIRSGGWKSRSSTQLRSQNKLIFDILRKKNVRKIIRVIVEDSALPSHRDGAIERLLIGFDVEEWDWKKIDLCSTVIRSAAPDTRKLSLYSSGNNAVLRSWSTEDGLAQLRKLTDVRVSVGEQLEGPERTRRYLESFIERMAHCLPSVHVTVQIESNVAHTEIEMTRRRMGPNSWLNKMDVFADFIQNVPRRMDSQIGVKVALIDDGVDLLQPALKNSVKNGISFASQSHTLETKPYYFSSTGHGTLMAKLICRICPTAYLYAARIDDPLTGQLNIDSAVKAINWAIAYGVDIISMCWTYEDKANHPNSPGVKALKETLQHASDLGILLFASAANSGASVSRTLPADFHEVFSIGAATATGNSSSWTDEGRTDFILPGSDPGMKALHVLNTEDSDADITSGSSFATALASGLVALILYCVEICELGEEFRSQLQSYDGMRRVLRAMTDDSNFIGKTEKLFNLDNIRSGGDEALRILEKDIRELLLSAL